MNKSLLKKSLAFFIVSLLLEALSATPKEKIVRVGYYENGVFQEGSEPGIPKKGYGYEYYRKIAEYTGWEYDYFYGSFETLYEKFLKGDIDLIAGIGYKQENEKKFFYPELPMGNTAFHLVKKNDALDITAEPTTLNGKKIGVHGSAMLEILQAWLTEKKVKALCLVYDTQDELIGAFEGRKIDVIMVEGGGSLDRKNVDAFASVGKSEFYLCVTKNRPDLLKELNLAQTHLENEDPSFIPLLNTKYFSNTISSRAFSEKERKWISTHNELKVGYLDSYLPFCEMDSNGNLTGLLKELVPEIIEKLELKDEIKISFHGYDSSYSMIEDLHKENLDVIFPVGGGQYYMEECGINQSTPVITTTVAIVFKKNLSLRSDRSFAVNRKNLMQEYFIKTNYPEAKIVRYDSVDECLRAVQMEEVDCTTLNGLRANSILKNFKYNDLDYHEANFSDDRAFGVKIGNETVLKLINRGIKSVESQFIINRSYYYSEQLYKYTFRDYVNKNLFQIVIGGIILVAMLIAFFVVDNRKKQRYLIEETKKNKALEQAKIAQKLQLEKIENLLVMLKRAQNTTEKYITDMIKFASTGNDANDILNQLLKYLGTNIEPDRVYIFEMNKNGSFDNTYEWCRAGIPSEKHKLQNLPYEGHMEHWIDQFRINKNIVIKSIDSYKKVCRPLYDILKPHGIQSMVAVPIYMHGEIEGFLGVVNPPHGKFEATSELFNLIEFIFGMMLRIRDNALEIEESAIHDQLTGCKNRKALKWAFEGEFDQEKSFSIISFDMNGLKKVNDTQGHEAGDNFICRIAKTLQEIFGPENIYRMGGDEFIVVLTGLSREKYDDYLKMCALQIGTTASIGSVFVETVQMDFRELLKKADMAMYKDKDKFYQNKRKYR